MKARARQRVSTMAIYVVLAAAAALFIGSSYVSAFNGRLVIGLDRQESVAVGINTIPQCKPPGLMLVWGSEIPFDDPETAAKYISESEQYQAARLPFSVRVDKIDVALPPSQHLLKFSGAEPAKRVEMRPGDEVSIDGKPFKIAGMDKWSGLMRNPQGVPMAAVVLTGDAAAAPTAILLASDIWRLTPGGAAVCFKWHPSEAEARQAAAAPPPGLESARWGVIDRGAVNWFGSFTPGAGAVLSSGEEVALVSFDEKKTAVAVEIKQGTEKRAVWVRANEVVDGIPVRFEYPGLAKYVFILHAWEDGKAIVAEYGNGQPVAQKELLQRHWLYRESSEVNLRLDDVFSAAVAVTESESTLWAAVLKAESGDEIVLREGEARRFGDSLVEYGRLTQRPAPTCTLTIGGDRQVVLKPMESVRVGDWSLRLSVPWDDFETAALLDADYMPGRRWALLLGAIGVTVLLSRFAARASRRIEPPIARDEASQ